MWLSGKTFDLHVKDLYVMQGVWLSGRAFALHVKGPGFDPRHLHLFMMPEVGKSGCY